MVIVFAQWGTFPSSAQNPLWFVQLLSFFLFLELLCGSFYSIIFLLFPVCQVCIVALMISLFSPVPPFLLYTQFYEDVVKPVICFSEVNNGHPCFWNWAIHYFGHWPLPYTWQRGLRPECNVWYGKSWHNLVSQLQIFTDKWKIPRWEESPCQCDDSGI